MVIWDFLFEAAGPGCTYVISQKLATDIQITVKTHWHQIQEVGLHDWFVYAYARAHGYRWVIDDFSGMLYRQHAKNQVGANAGLKAFLYRARKVVNGWGLSQASLIANIVGMGEDPFVKKWSSGRRFGLIFLALHAHQCRRRIRDKVLFGFSCILLSVTRKRS